ncbi:Uncharacterized [Moorella glycerini]|uniref:Uncharacterized protein n=1 Tax=Neomoorella stamsii TaxID=1266720 RepID=A0A9X7J5F4_9FIRM|nr:hypothetical protein MOST_01200 [Moorella stamsii]CEP68536.1 Uncharacterized [Moorella glycerini]
MRQNFEIHERYQAELEALEERREQLEAICRQLETFARLRDTVAIQEHVIRGLKHAREVELREHLEEEICFLVAEVERLDRELDLARAKHLEAGQKAREAYQKWQGHQARQREQELKEGLARLDKELQEQEGLLAILRQTLDREKILLAGLHSRCARAAERIYRLRQVLAPLATHPWEWVRGWWAGVNAALGERKTAGLDLEDLDGYEELLKVLLALPELEDSTPERVFSQRVLGDSKAFEQRVKKRLLAILKSYGPEEYETDAEYLDSVGLTDNPKMVLVAGPFTFRVGGTAVNVGELPGGVGLAAHTVRVMEITAVTAPWVLLVENLTSYYQVVQGVSELAVPSREREGDRDLAVGGPAGLVVYTGGFPHRGLQLFLRRLQGYRESAHDPRRPPLT